MWRRSKVAKLEATMSSEERRAMFELQMELHARSSGVAPLITADEVMEVGALLSIHNGDFRSLVAGPAR